MTDQQRCSVNTRQEGLRQNLKIFALIKITLLDILLPRGTLTRKKEKMYMEEATPRQRSRSRSETRLDYHKIPGTTTFQ